MEELRAAWGANLKAAREDAGMTKVEVAEKIGVAYQSVQDWEKGDSAPTAENQARLLALFDADRDDLFPLEVG